MVVQRIVKPKTQKGKRFLDGRESKIHENPKTSMFIKGGNTSETITDVLKELYALKKHNSIMYKRKNIFRPFENETSLEFFSKKSDSSLFLFGSHSKKRPHNLVLGRLFDFHILDMIELGVEKFRSMYDFQAAKCVTGTKPCLLFSGDDFDLDTDHKRLKSLLIDFFRGPVVKQIRLAGLEHVIMINAIDGKICIRNYKVLLKKSGCRTPRIELEELGPSLDLVIRRTKLASDDLFKTALKVPRTAKARKIKNISHNPFGSKLGRIHMQKQDLGKLQTRKMKGLKRKKEEKASQKGDSVTKKSKSSAEES